MPLIAVANQKGGVGKTTTTLSLGAYLAAAGHKVLLLDLDPQANLTSASGVEPTTEQLNSYQLLSDEDTDIKKVIKTLPTLGLDILPASIDLAGAEVELVGALSREQILSERLKPVAGKYDFILVDCPPSLGLLTLNALVAAQYVLIPVQAEYFALEGLSKLLETVKLVKSRLNRKLELIGVAVTMFDHRTNLARQVAQELFSQLGDKVFETLIPRNIRLSEAPSHGQPINLYEPNSLGAKAYAALAKELAMRVASKA